MDKTNVIITDITHTHTPQIIYCFWDAKIQKQ